MELQDQQREIIYAERIAQIGHAILKRDELIAAQAQEITRLKAELEALKSKETPDVN